MKSDNKNKIANNSNKKDLGISFLLLTFVCVVIFSFVFISRLDTIPKHFSENASPEPVGLIYVSLVAIWYICTMVYYFIYAVKKHYKLAFLLIIITTIILIVDILFSIGGAAIWLLFLLVPWVLMSAIFLYIIGCVIGTMMDIFNKKDNYDEIDDEEMTEQ